MVALSKISRLQNHADFNPPKSTALHTASLRHVIRMRNILALSHSASTLRILSRFKSSSLTGHSIRVTIHCAFVTTNTLGDTIKPLM